jgi:hypothetical protein
LNRWNACLICLYCALLGSGCGTTRMTDTQRAASEMLLVSQAIDNAVGQLDFSDLQNRRVFLDTQYLDGTIDKGYLISALRQHLLAHGAMIQEDRLKSEYVVEPRSGAVGTDKHSLLFGTPQMTLPTVVPGVPSSVPEIALIKKTDQKGIAKLAVFAYNRNTGRALWQSGLVQAKSTLKDTWIFGAGPISQGSIREKTELAGEALPKLPLPFGQHEDTPVQDPPNLALTSANQAHSYKNSDMPAPQSGVPFALLSLTGPAALIDKPIIPILRPAPLFVLEPPPNLLIPSAPDSR